MNHWMKERERKSNAIYFEFVLQPYTPDPKLECEIKIGPSLAPNSINCVSDDPNFVSYVKQIINKWTFQNSQPLNAEARIFVYNGGVMAESWSIPHAECSGYTLAGPQAFLFITGPYIRTVNSSYFKI